MLTKDSVRRLCPRNTAFAASARQLTAGSLSRWLLDNRFRTSVLRQRDRKDSLALSKPRLALCSDCSRRPRSLSAVSLPWLAAHCTHFRRLPLWVSSLTIPQEQ